MSFSIDIGCGTGKPVAAIFAAAGHRVLGIDESQKMVEICNHLGLKGSQFQQAEITQFQLSKDSKYYPLDAVLGMLSLCTISYKDLTHLLARWKSWLQPQGIIAIGTLTAANKSHPEMHEDERGYLDNVEVEFMGYTLHETILTDKEWKHVILDAGFDLLDTMIVEYMPKDVRCRKEVQTYYLARKRD